MKLSIEAVFQNLLPVLKLYVYYRFLTLGSQFWNTAFKNRIF